MTKIYLVHSAKTEEVKKLFKRGFKFEDLNYLIGTINLWAYKKVSEAKKDCRESNLSNKEKYICWYEEINLF